MIIGNKEIFAVEFKTENDNPKMGYAKLWIQNNFLGTIEDLIFLHGYLIGLLDQILRSKPIPFEIENKTKKDIFQLVKSTDDQRSDYALIGSTFVDDFETYSFENNKTIFIIWKLRTDQEMIFEELKNYSTDVHFASVSKTDVEKVKEKLLIEIAKTII